MPLKNSGCRGPEDANNFFLNMYTMTIRPEYII